MSKTDFNPAEYDVSNPNHKSLTFSEFKELVFQLKERNKNTLLTRVINATPWALDYVVAPALGGTTYNGYSLTEDGRVVPSWSTEGYKKVLEFDRWLQENNLWVENPAGGSASIDDFYAGKNAISINWPDATNNIEYARRLKDANNMDAIVLAPIVPDGSPEGTKGTNARMQTAFSGFIMPSSSTQVDLMAMYLDWLYTPNENGEYENYELAKYGIEGVHWEKGTKQYNGETIKTWDYPAAKKAEFKVTKPYSGKFLIISNYTLEDRVWADYNDQELAWWFAQNTMPTSPDHYDLEGVNFRSFTVNDGALKALDTDMGEKYTAMRGYAWSSSKMPAGQTIASLHDALTSEFTGKYKPLIDFYTQEYNKFLSTKPARV